MDINILMYNSFKQHISFTIKRCHTCGLDFDGAEDMAAGPSAQLVHPGGLGPNKIPTDTLHRGGGKRRNTAHQPNSLFLFLKLTVG